LWEAVHSREIKYSVGLSLVTCTTSALLALLLAVPVGYLLARGRFPGKSLLDAMPSSCRRWSWGSACSSFFKPPRAK